jgi:hypothetical protein
VGRSNGGGINNLNEEEMDTLTQEIEETLLKKALSNKNSKEWAEKEIERRIRTKNECAEKEGTDIPATNEGTLIPQIGLIEQI